MSSTIALKLEVVELDGDARRAWYELACTMRELHNFVWRQWEAWHTTRDSSQKLREDFAAYSVWKQAPKKERGKKPVFRVQPWPNDFGKAVYHQCTERFPGLHCRCLVLALQKIRGNVTGKKSTATPALKWWQAILLDHDRRGNSRHPLPIPFDLANCEILPCDTKGRIEMRVRVDRISVTGKKNAISTVHEFKLKTGGKRWQYAKLAHECAAGRHKLRGSQLWYSARDKKWFACLTIDKPEAEAVELDPELAVILRPGKHCNWRLRIKGATRTVAGRGNHVANVRKSVLLQRWSRQEGYRYAPKRKGRGIKKALAPLYKLQKRWNNFTRRLNDELTATVLALAIERGAGKIMLIGGDPRRRLATAGKIEGREDSTGWPWYQVEQLLEQKANRVGVEVVKRAFCGGDSRRNRSRELGLVGKPVKEAVK